MRRPISLLAIFLLYCVLTAANGNVHRHGHRQPQPASPEPMNYLEMVMLHNANANCGIGCYKIRRHQVLEISYHWSIFKVDIQFSDMGSQSGRDQYMNDQFDVTRFQAGMPPTLLSRFSVKEYDFYAKRLRATQITESVLDWLHNSMLPFFYIQFSKVGDPNPNNLRFAKHPLNQPVLILHLNGSRVVRRRRSTPDLITARCSSEDDNYCCLRNKTVRVISTLRFLDVPRLFQVNVCEGLCMRNPAGDPLQQVIDSSRPCCQSVRRDRGDSTLVYEDGNNSTFYRVLIQDTSCRCG